MTPNNTRLRPDHAAVLSLLAADHAAQLNQGLPPGEPRRSVDPLDMLTVLLTEAAARRGLPPERIEEAIAAAEGPADVARARQLVAVLKERGMSLAAVADRLGLGRNVVERACNPRQRFWSQKRMADFIGQLEGLVAERGAS